MEAFDPVCGYDSWCVAMTVLCGSLLGSFSSLPVVSSAQQMSVKSNNIQVFIFVKRSEIKSFLMWSLSLLEGCPQIRAKIFNYLKIVRRTTEWTGCIQRSEITHIRILPFPISFDCLPFFFLAPLSFFLMPCTQGSLTLHGETPPNYSSAVINEHSPTKYHLLKNDLLIKGAVA